MLPLWIKISYTFFAVVTVAVYAVKYPPANFLWFSDIALVLTVPALWLESSLLASTLIVGVLLPEVFWNAGYFGRLLTGKRLAGLTDYMFDPGKPLYLRALSLFHVFLPLLLLWMVRRLGYAPQAWLVQTLLAWIVLPLTYGLADPKLNVNWVRGFGSAGRLRLPPLVHLCLLMIGFPALVYLPAHFLLAALFN
ncbi:MAG: membrane-associated protein [Nitrospirota bacterium]|nr:membrane-associated protein [Nitrospirota bacterium]